MLSPRFGDPARPRALPRHTSMGERCSPAGGACACVRRRVASPRAEARLRGWSPSRVVGPVRAEHLERPRAASINAGSRSERSLTDCTTLTRRAVAHGLRSPHSTEPSLHDSLAASRRSHYCTMAHAQMNPRSHYCTVLTTTAHSKRSIGHFTGCNSATTMELYASEKADSICERDRLTHRHARS